MNKSRKLQAVTEAIHKACPDLMEIKIGCKVIIQINDHFKCEAEICTYSVKGRVEYRRLTRTHTEYGWVLEKEAHRRGVGFVYEILGQPIGGLEVLRALKKLNKWTDSLIFGYEKQEQHDDQCPCCGQHSVKGWHPVDFIPGVLNLFDLTKTLDQQEEPVINLLHSILCHDNN